MTTELLVLVSLQTLGVSPPPVPTRSTASPPAPVDRLHAIDIYSEEMSRHMRFLMRPRPPPSLLARFRKWLGERAGELRKRIGEYGAELERFVRARNSLRASRKGLRRTLEGGIKAVHFRILRMFRERAAVLDEIQRLNLPPERVAAMLQDPKARWHVDGNLRLILYQAWRMKALPLLSVPWTAVRPFFPDRLGAFAALAQAHTDGHHRMLREYGDGLRRLTAEVDQRADAIADLRERLLRRQRFPRVVVRRVGELVTILDYDPKARRSTVAAIVHDRFAVRVIVEGAQRAEDVDDPLLDLDFAVLTGMQ
jgi:hypothetical protein